MTNEQYFYLFNINPDSVMDLYPDDLGIQQIAVISDNFSNDIEAINEVKAASKYFVSGDRLTLKFNGDYYPVKTASDDEDPSFTNWIHLNENEIFSAVMTLEAKSDDSNFIDSKVLVIKQTSEVEAMLENKNNPITVH